MNERTGGPAFPSAVQAGMTLRDFFAAVAMHAAINNSKALNVKPDRDLAMRCYSTADEMLKAKASA